ncbi:MAG TPA: putative lipid II flippase FtsW [Gammaproteobacteria bacterium]|nr:putative lipid II flippase FtsW [Gammaproteobacteria bacterium]
MNAVSMTDSRSSRFLDYGLLLSMLFLLGLGIVMVASTSMGISESKFGEPFHYLSRQLLFVVVGVFFAIAVFKLPLQLWQHIGFVLLLISVALLIAVLIPDVGKTVNGSSRWLPMGPFNFQVSEFVKLVVPIYMAGYLVRHAEEVRGSFSGFLKPMAILSVFGVLLLLEPDFGATVIILTTALGMLFLSGVRFGQFFLLLVLIAAAMAMLAIFSPYRWERLTTFLNPWADPFDSGFQLTQALIAFGQGEWFGVGLGGGVQKLFYLPEAHTDFLYATLAEELGLMGSLLVILLFGFIVWRAFDIGQRALRIKKVFEAHLAHGLGLWFGLQAFVNLGVNMGMLPTKGLTLPLMSYGGSSLIVTCIAAALLLRIDYEVRGHVKKREQSG